MLSEYMEVILLFQNNATESPFMAVEQLARQALEAAVGEEAAGDGEADAADAPEAAADIHPAEAVVE